MLVILSFGSGSMKSMQALFDEECLYGRSFYYTQFFLKLQEKNTDNY